MKNTIWFDMDGTVADLYAHKDWLISLENSVPVFDNLRPICGMLELEVICRKLMERGFTIGIITWLPHHASPEYRMTCTTDKIKWAKRHMPYVNEIYALPYGTPKQHAGFEQGSINYLVDDNAEVIKMWEDVNQNIGIQVQEGNTCEVLKEKFFR